jgi:calcineurin-like phosphoesterase family protein
MYTSAVIILLAIADTRYKNLEITRRKFIGVCGGAALLSMGIRSSGYIERILDLNQSAEDITRNIADDIRFIIVGDPHVMADNNDNRENISDKGNKRLGQVVNFVNKSDVDFVVFMGDMADDGKRRSNEVVKDILKNLNKKYYVVAGNHDILISPNMFEEYYGPMEHIEYINGYQLLFVGIYEEKKGDEETLKWSFDFSKADKNAPTLVFIHGPVTDLPIGCIHCQIKIKAVLEYAKSIREELEKFNNLIGVYSGHIHYDSDQVINGTRYVTINGLNNFRFTDYIKAVHFSDKVGYSKIKGNKSYFELVPY